ncbi:MAG: hypothetical protein EO766_12225 [Hydrotalea sp. AMD]|uniref:hypothetical protein n=1 Tax=Hydrotalea sp. AMD TaxID=2501297 RepID=UPI0010261EBC|nr:hypothetical protein [Hydrotalea sp. AMD]RWZ87284.1 MAG: hypothetical protein EO766_12225 [Hydrotalea sp. AMD]
MNPVDVLPQLLTRLTNIRDLNCGGCGVFAAHVAKHLKDIVPTRVAVFNRGEDIKIDEIRPKLRNNHSCVEWADHGMRYDHVMVEFDYDGNTYLFDSRGIFPVSDKIDLDMYKMTRSGYLTIEEICAIAANPYPWNHWFNRSQIQSLKNKIQYFFKKHRVVEA